MSRYVSTGRHTSSLALTHARIYIFHSMSTSNQTPSTTTAMDLTDSLTVQAHVSSTFVPLSAVTRLSGGTSNFTFRATLLSPLPAADAGTIRTVIIKHAEPFAAMHKDFALDTIRCVRPQSSSSRASPGVQTDGDSTTNTWRCWPARRPSSQAWAEARAQ